MTMESKRAVIYARYSSSRQREESIERQIEICNDYAVAHNMLVIGSYVDRKKTGKTDTRPDFQRMIYESSKHLFDVVLVWRYDRFARNLDDHGAYERLLHQNSVDLISATEEIPEGSHSAIIKAVILGGNESYSVELAAKVSDGMHRAAMQGQTSGGPRVFGYRVVDKHYVLDEGEAQIIRQIFTWYDQGKSMTEIVNQLNAQGAVNAAGKPFIISVMRRILTNQMYIGIRLYKGEDIGIRVPAIIDKELFDRVQIQVGKNKSIIYVNEESPVSTFHITPSYIPSGFSQIESSGESTGHYYGQFQNSAGDWFSLRVFPVENTQTISWDNEFSSYYSISFDSNQAIWGIMDDGSNTLLWESNFLAFQVRGNLNITELIKISEGIEVQ